MKIPKVYIIHVSDDNIREKHIRKELAGKVSNFEFINEGDISDLNDDVLNEYFDKSLHGMEKPNEISCTYKHLIAYQKIIATNEELHLIFEDDIILYPHFVNELKKILEEIKARELKNFLISLEDSTNQYIKRSERRKNQLLYHKNRGRLTGAYLVDKTAVKNFWDYVKTHKCDRLIDNFQTVSAQEGTFDFYWCKSAIATQGSKNGLLPSHIAKARTGVLRKLGVKTHKLYKKLLYEFR